MADNTLELRYPIQALAEKFSAYARIEGPVPPGACYCPLTYGIPATTSELARIAGYRSIGHPITRLEIRRALKHVNDSATRIAEYIDWLSGLIDRSGNSDSRERALTTAKAYLVDLHEAQGTLTDILPLAAKATRRRSGR